MNFFLEIVSFLQTLPPESVMIFEFLACGILLLVAERFFKLAGLYVYTAVCVIIVNIAVLKTVQFSLYPAPMALGTVVFSSLFLCSDMINERYGEKAAIKSMWLGFFGYLVALLLMFITLGYGQSSSTEFHSSASFFLVPGPSLLLASLVAYFLGQYMDVFVYSFLRTRTGKKALWLRSFLSTFVAIFIDNTIFSLLAWHFFAIIPLGFSEIFWVYILGASILRVVVSIGNIPFMYMSQFLNRSKKNNVPSLS